MLDILKILWGKYQNYKQFQDDRNNVRIGDTVIAYIKMTLKSKVTKKMTAAQKQALKQELESGKSMEEIMESRLKAQPFRGVVIAIKGHGANKMITIRKIGVHGIGVERIVPLYSRVLEKLEIIKKGKVRRSKLYYLRNRIGKRAMAVKFRDERNKTNNVISNTQDTQLTKNETTKE